jgi:ERCC4-type nuclease
MTPTVMLLDPRKGSGDLLPILKSIGVNVEHKFLDFGDAQIVGRGPNDRPILVGVEIKKTNHDLLSCIADNRFVGFQLPGLLTSYELAYLLVEGQMTSDEYGNLKVWTGRKWDNPPFGTWKYEAICSWVHTLQNKAVQVENAAEFRVEYTANRRGTAVWLMSLWKWWQDWEGHESHRRAFFSNMQLDGALNDFVATKKMKVACDIADGMGPEKALVASQHFKTIREMINADVKEWLKVKGVGPKIANRFVEEVLREEK